MNYKIILHLFWCILLLQCGNIIAQSSTESVSSTTEETSEPSTVDNDEKQQIFAAVSENQIRNDTTSKTVLEKKSKLFHFMLLQQYFGLK